MNFRYTATKEDGGKKLILTILQEDSEGNRVEETRESFLSVQAKAPPPEKQSLKAGILAVIVAVACFILLAVILLIYAWRSGKYCFAKDTPVYVIQGIP